MDLEESSMGSEKSSMDWWQEETSKDSEESIVVICPRVEAEVELGEGGFYLETAFHGDPKEIKCEADTSTFKKLVQVEGIKYVYCEECYGNGHEECYKSSAIKHPLHQKHVFMFVKCDNAWLAKCFCCENRLKEIFYLSRSFDVAINLACLDKTLFPVNYPKRHEHTLSLFLRQTTLNCNVCALDDSTSPSYICPPCGFVVHKRCINLPWIIRISRHPHHRISFTSFFSLGDRICNICRRKINNEYGGYICNKNGCSYFAHSRCATRSNVWDGKELEGVPEEVEEEVEPPFERLGDGTIRHFSHKDHPLKLNIEDSTRVYDDSRSCQACVRPIYYGNFYSCTLDCSFILHEDCANLSKRIYHAIHPHPLLLQVEPTRFIHECSACNSKGTGFVYECNREKCDFRMHVQCATIYEPLNHNSHVHPLYLTPGAEECIRCSICRRYYDSSCDIFNCIESECEFSLCYRCASLPQKVRYKHDKHFLTLSYGEEREHWCELCEKKIEPGERFYTCDDYCCVTLHIQCLLGRDMNLTLGTHSFLEEFDVLPNNHMTRPICSKCNKRCTQKIVFQAKGLITCSLNCY